MLSWKTSLGLALAFPLLCLDPAHADKSCTLKKLGSMAMHITPGNQLVVQARINGTDVPMLLDTGAWWNGLTHPMANRLGLTFLNSHVALRPIGGAAPNEGIKVGTTELGTTHADELYYFALAKGGDGSDGNAAGVLAAYNRIIDIEIDPAAGKVNFFDQDRCPDKAVYWASDYGTLPTLLDPARMTLDVELDGQKVRAMIDTGASWTTMPIGTARDRFGLTLSSPGVTPVPGGITIDSQPQEVGAYGFQTLKIGDIVIHNPRIMIAELRHDTDLAGESHFNRQSLFMPDLLIGMNILKNFHMFIAYREQQIYYTGVNAGHAAAQ